MLYRLTVRDPEDINGPPLLEETFVHTDDALAFNPYGVENEARARFQVLRGRGFQMSDLVTFTNDPTGEHLLLSTTFIFEDGTTNVIELVEES